jgi:Major Facilitator Superfamily
LLLAVQILDRQGGTVTRDGSLRAVFPLRDMEAKHDESAATLAATGAGHRPAGARMSNSTSQDERTGPAAPPAIEAGGFTHRQIVTILIGLILGMFLAALDQTIVATAIRTIADDLHGFSQQAWPTTAFLITSTISTPLYGKLSDIYGRRPLFLLAITVFIAGSALCGLASRCTSSQRSAPCRAWAPAG